MLKVARAEGFHQSRPRRRLQHLGADLAVLISRRPIDTTKEWGRRTPASSGTKVIIIHSCFPPSLLSSRYAKLAGVFLLGSVGARSSISSLNDPFTFTVVRWLNVSIGRVSSDLSWLHRLH